MPGRGGLSAHINFVRAWNWMATICHNETGVVLSVTSAADLYRSFEQQVSLFQSRYDKVYIPIRNTLEDKRVWDGVTYYKRRGVAAVATPGTSNHGWGIAVDVCEFADSKVVGIEASKAWPWLLENAVSFGFAWELVKEPWHIRHIYGDDVSQRVKDCDKWVAAQLQPAPPAS